MRTRRFAALAALTTTAAVAAALVVGAPADATTPSTPTAKTYYVDCSRHASGNGSKTKPWRSLAAVSGHGRFSAGDRILLRRGTTCRGRLAPAGSGQPGHPITLGAWSSGSRPVIAGGGTGKGSGAVQLRNQHDWVIQDLQVTNRSKGTWTTVYRAGVLVINTGVGRLANVTVQRVRVHDVTSDLADTKAGNSRQWGGIAVITRGSFGSGFDHVRLLNNTVDHVGRSGIVSWNSVYQGTHDTDLRVAGNTVRSARGDSFIAVGVLKSRLDHNVSAYGSNMGGCPNCGHSSPPRANTGVWVGAAHDVRLDRNEIYGEHVGGGDGEAFSIDVTTTHVVLEYNYAHDNEGGGVLLCGSSGAIVRFNILEDNKKSAVAFIGSRPATNSSIYNNTIYASRSTGANVVRTFNGNHGSGISFKNNLVYSYGPGKYGWPTKAKTSANTLVGVLGTGRPKDPRTSHKDPGLKHPGTGRTGFKTLGGYKPKHPSSFSKGVAIPKSVTRDFFGKKINPKKPPRGAAG